MSGSLLRGLPVGEAVNMINLLWIIPLSVWLGLIIGAILSVDGRDDE